MKTLHQGVRTAGRTKDGACSHLHEVSNFPHQFCWEITISYWHILHLLSRAEVCEDWNPLQSTRVRSCSHGYCGMSQVLNKGCNSFTWAQPWMKHPRYRSSRASRPALVRSRRAASCDGEKRQRMRTLKVLLCYTASSAIAEPSPAVAAGIMPCYLASFQ